MHLKSLIFHALSFTALATLLLTLQVWSTHNPEHHSSQNDNSYLSKSRALSEDENGFLERLISTSSPGTPSLAALSRANRYISYMEIPLPSRLSKMARNQGRSPITLQFGMKAPQVFYDSMRMLDAYSQSQYFSPSFLINFWGQTITFIVVFCLIGFFHVMIKVAAKKGWETTYSVFSMLKNIFQWNFVFILLATNVEDIIYYAALQWRGMDNSSGVNIVGILECFAMIFVLVGFSIGIFILVQKERFAKKFIQVHDTSDTYSDFLDRCQGLQVLHTGFKDETLFIHLFYVIYLSKNALSAIFGGFLDVTPILQIIFQVLLNSMMLTYILCLQPVKKTVNMVQLILYESISLLTNFAMTAAVEVGEKNEQDTSQGVSVGDFIIVGNIFQNVLVIYFLIYKVIKEGKRLYKVQKSDPKMPKLAWMQLLPIIMQQAGMGFENMELQIATINQAKAIRLQPLSNVSRSEMTKIFGDDPETPMRRLNPPGTITDTDNIFAFPMTRNHLESRNDLLQSSQVSDTSAASPNPLLKGFSFNLAEQVNEAIERQKIAEIGGAALALSPDTIEMMRARLNEKSKYTKVKRELISVQKKKIGSSAVLKALEDKPLVNLKLKDKSKDKKKKKDDGSLITVSSSKSPKNTPNITLHQKEEEPHDEEEQQLEPKQNLPPVSDKELVNQVEQGLMELDDAQKQVDKEYLEREEAKEGKFREKEDELKEELQKADDELNPFADEKSQENLEGHPVHQEQDEKPESLFKVTDLENEEKRLESLGDNFPFQNGTSRNFEDMLDSKSKGELDEETERPKKKENLKTNESKKSKSPSRSPPNKRPGMPRLVRKNTTTPKVKDQAQRLQSSPYK